MLELGHLRRDEFGGVLLPAAVSVSLLTLLHLFIIILNVHIKDQWIKVKGRVKTRALEVVRVCVCTW